MKEFNYNDITAEERLSLMLDGELPLSEEESLFSELSSDKDLQSQMKDTMAMREAIKADHEAFSPPAELTKAVFNRVGYTAPNAGTGVSAAGAWQKFLKRSSMPVMLLLLGFSSVMVYNYLDVDPSAQQSVNIPVVTSHETDAHVTNISEPVNNNTAVFAKNTEIKESAKQYNHTRAVDKKKHNIVVLSSKEKNATAATSHDNAVGSDNNTIFNDISGINELQSSVTNTYGSSHNSALLVLKMNPFASNDFDLKEGSDYKDVDKDIELSVRGIYSISSPEQALQNGLSSFSAGILFKMSDELFLGFEGGHEIFNRASLSEINNEDSPHITWYGVSSRYNFNTLQFSDFVPFVTLNAGASSVGPLGGLSLGTKYNLTDDMGMLISYNMNMLMYKHNSSWKSSLKTGLQAGLFIRF